MTMLELTAEERAMSEGRRGEASAFAINLLVKAARMQGAARLQPIEYALVGTCFAVIDTHHDLVSWLVERGARVAVPTFTNVGIFDRDNPDLRPSEEGKHYALRTRGQIALHRKLGCEISLTCAPYQLPGAPGLGVHCAVSESNAVSYFNSVAGARTQKYGDYLDLAAALTGRVPYAGLHTDEGRRGEVSIEVETLPAPLARDQLAFQLIGYAVGRLAVTAVPVIEGLSPDTTRDDLRALGAAAASSGGVALYHAVGLTPEASSAAAAFGGREPRRRCTVGLGDLAAARSALSGFEAGPIDAVVLGTPHASIDEVGQLTAQLSGERVRAGVTFYIQMNRHVFDSARERGWIETLRACGVTTVVDTCIYWRPLAAGLAGRVVTNSAKYAYYAPGELGIETALASLGECVQSALRGCVWRDPALGFEAVA